MEPLFTMATKFFTLLFVFTAAAYIGVAAPVREIVAVLQERTLMMKILLANILIVPVLGLVLVSVLPLSGGVKAAIMLLAFAPGGMNALQFITRVRGELSFASAVLFVLTVVSLVLTPLAASVFLSGGTLVEIPYGRIILASAGFVFLPLAAGLAVRTYVPALGKTAARPLNLISTVAFVLATVLSASMKREAMRGIGPEGVLAMLALIAGSMAIGWLSGGPETGRKRVLANTTSCRNAALCLVIALGVPDHTAVLAILVYLLLTVPANMLFTLYGMLRDRRRMRPRSSPVE
ncbi:MAG TPA: hypothetical protein PKM41_04910 [Deltaproteobacteria bacterium]|jgi:BASS family bile acid:Na+ symporter|nr:hypothetical protein [Deltaproteobacteria bacterium]HOI05499.1 hypothetical protein [Deltaproteobacteria bacterium]